MLTSEFGSGYKRLTLRLHFGPRLTLVERPEPLERKFVPTVGPVIRVSTPPETYSAPREEQKDEGHKREPEPRAGVDVHPVKFAQLVVNIRVQRNINRECYEREKCRKERYDGCKEGGSDVAGERQGQRDESDDRSDWMDSQSTGPGGPDGDLIEVPFSVDDPERDRVPMTFRAAFTVPVARIVLTERPYSKA